MKNLKNYKSFNESVDLELDFRKPSRELLISLLGDNDEWRFKVVRSKTFYFFKTISSYSKFKEYFDEFNNGEYNLIEIDKGKFNDRFKRSVSVSEST